MSTTIVLTYEPCPFCGYEDPKEVLRPHFDTCTIAIECPQCKTRGPEQYIKSMRDSTYSAVHIIRWNRRVCQ